MAYQTSTCAEFSDKKTIPNLDGLRGVSIILVMIHHIPPLTSTIGLNLQQNGRLGVMLFFVISGFLITHLALKEKRLTGIFNLKDFYLRRALRIFPLYYAVLSIVCFLVYALNVYSPEAKQEFSERLLSYFFYYSNLTGPIHGPYSLLWSLAVEEQFYLCFALIFYFCSTAWSRNIFFTLTVVRLLMPFWGPYFVEQHFVLIALRYQEAILLGVSTAYLYENQVFYRRFSRYIGNFYGLIAIIVSIVLCLLLFSVNNDRWLETAIDVLFALLVATAAIAPPLPWIGGPLLSHIGKISYGIYLFHTIVFFGVKRFVSSESWIVFSIGAPITIFIATLSYRYFEAYFLQMKKKFSP